MQAPLDPRVGNQRQKSLLQKIAMMAMQRQGYTNAFSRFARLGATRGSVRSMTSPGSRPGGITRGAQPFGSLGNAPRGAQAGEHLGHGMPAGGFGTGDVRTAPLQAGLPTDNLNGVGHAPVVNPGAIIPPANPGSNPFVTGAPGSAGLGGVATADPEYNAFLAGQTDVNPFSVGQAAGGSPASPVTAAGGLIPLGGGMFYDPATGNVHGGPGGSGAGVSTAGLAR